ncbi:MAG: nitroreductase family protein [Planctomycetia bacterium]|nr:nitroreductase family protein [Planctomycetia bacterium]
MSKRILIDRNLCTSCGRCLIGCSARVYSYDGAGAPVLADDADERCIGCGHCVCLCPSGAIAVDSISATSITSVDTEHLPTPSQFAELVKYRRSVRNYKQEAIATDELKELLAFLQYAPTAKNLHPLTWVVVNNPGSVRELSQMAIEGVRGDDRFAGMVAAWDAGYDWVNRGAPCVAIATAGPESHWYAQDGAIAAETLDLAAPLLGLGTCWAGLLMNFLATNSELRQRLGIAEKDQIAAALMIGYPDDEIYTSAPNRPEPVVRFVE